MSAWSEIQIQSHRTPDGRRINVRYFRPPDAGPFRQEPRRQRELTRVAYDFGVDPEVLVDYNARQLAEHGLDLTRLDTIMVPV